MTPATLRKPTTHGLPAPADPAVKQTLVGEPDRGSVTGPWPSSHGPDRGLVQVARTRCGPDGAYIGAAIYFTSSASFANPAVTIARGLSDTYTGIAPAGIAAFIPAQALGTVLAAVVIRWLFDPTVLDAAQVVVPHEERLVAAVPDRRAPHA
jgi:hypothetical protein